MKAYPSYKESGIKWIGQIPEHWVMANVGRMMNLGRGRVISNIEIGENSGEYPVYSSQTSDNGVMGYINTYDFEGDYVTWTTDGANAGRVFFRTGKFNCTNVCGTMKPKNEKVYPPFIPYLLNLGTKYYVRYDINPKLMNGEMAQIEICLPSIDEQKTIVNFLDRKTAQIDTLIEKKQRQIDLLQEQRTALINHAVTKGLNPNVKMKDSGVEWLGEIPSHWNLLHLRRGVEFLTDFEANGSFATIKDNVEVDVGEPYAWYVRATDLENERFGIVEGNRYCSEETYQFLTKTELFGGELLVTKRGEIGKAYLMPNIDVPATLAPNLYLVRLNEKLHPPFAYYWFTSAGNSELVLADKSTTIGALYKEDVKNCRCLFPPIDEQIEIAKYLNKVKQEFRGVIERINLQIELIKEYRTALISEAVTGKIDVRKAE